MGKWTTIARKSGKLEDLTSPELVNSQSQLYPISGEHNSRLPTQNGGMGNINRTVSVNGPEIRPIHSRQICNTWTHNQDAFKEDWSQENNYMVPPLSLIPQTLLKIIKNQAKGLLIIPDWKSSWWYPVALRISQRIEKFPRKMLLLKPESELLKNLEWREFLALEVNGTLYQTNSTTCA